MGINHLNPPTTLLDMKKIPPKSDFITFPNDADTLETQSHILLESIQSLAVKFCTLNDKMVELEKDQSVVYNRWKDAKDDLRIQTTRINGTIRNVQRQIKIHHWETNQNKAQMADIRTEMEHARRIKMHMDTSMNKTHTAGFRAYSHNRRLESKSVNARETINIFLEKKSRMQQES